MHPLEERVRTCTPNDFDALALDIFRFQYDRVPVYRNYCEYTGRTHPSRIEEIPFLPIRFFKSHEIIAQGMSAAATFLSSGTGGERSQHLVASTALYEHVFERIYREHIGAPEEQVILALLPNYLEQGNSSLVYMLDRLIQLTQSELSGFYLDNKQDLIEQYQRAVASGKDVIIFGVSYALLDLAELGPDLSEARIIETGGMKGRRKERTKAELHTALKSGLHCPNICSEYGMTELLSQGYSTAGGVFQTGSTMKVLLREVNDPYAFITGAKTGGINVIDLANLYSCAFIETQDLGKWHPNGFEIMGRFDHSDVRGCNLMIS